MNDIWHTQLGAAEAILQQAQSRMQPNSLERIEIRYIIDTLHELKNRAPGPARLPDPPDRAWLTRSIEVFFMNDPFSFGSERIEMLTDHIIGNWLMIQQVNKELDRRAQETPS